LHDLSSSHPLSLIFNILITSSFSDPNPIYFNNSIAYGTGGGATYIVKPTQNSVNFRIYASAPSPYGASGYINIYGIK
jgi:hypothetical protein